MESKEIIVEGARVHNLKNISTKIPKNQMTVITGLSGSGKSSLAFDTIYAEGQRRYMESFSVFARQYMGQIQRPDVDQIIGLSPVISIEQKTTGRNPRSTVGTITEVYDLMRLFFARIGDAFSYNTGKRMVKYTSSEIAKIILNDYNSEKIIILASQVRGRKGHYRELFESLRKQGFLRVNVDGEIRELKPKMQVDRFKTHDIEVVIDRCTVSSANKARLYESVERALDVGEGLMAIQIHETDNTRWYSKNLMCADTGISYEDPSPNTFSFNSPYGYCPACKGMGVRYEVDEDAIIPDHSLSIKGGAIAPLSHNQESVTMKNLMKRAKKLNIPIDKSLSDLSEEQVRLILYTDKKRGSKNDEGIADMILRWFGDSESNYVREWAEKYMMLIDCDVCEGTRLKKDALWFKVDDKNIAEINKLDINDAQEWFAGISKKLNAKKKKIAKEILKEINDRLNFLLNVGLHYLSLDRAAGTLSGGESQRIRLATQIGSQLTGITYILDEPSIGLHQEDNHKLIRALQNLRDVGNTVIVVEHDKDIMMESDYLIDMGPAAGENGGQIVFEGTPSLARKSNSLTSQFLNDHKNIEVPKRRREGTGKVIELNGCTGNNLKTVNLKVPLGKLVVVSGISGSGKSTLIDKTLYPILMNHCFHSKRVPMPFQSVTGLEEIDKCIEINQSPIGRTPRSNPATYTGLFTEIRMLYAMLPDSKIRGYKPGRFSFNVKGGRCENCKGDGMEKIEMNFLPDVYVKCQICQGKRYNKETLEVRYKGKSISDVLDMPIAEALGFFENIPKIKRKLQTLQDVGLGYLRLGQSSTTISGGEAQRVKLAAELSKKATGKTFYILDEPTTGLHFEDIGHLIAVLEKLVDKGNTVLVIEHNMDVIKMADYIVDMGPGGGKYGGKIVAQGAPEKIIKSKSSLTAKHLKKELA